MAPCSYQAAKYAVEHWHYSRTMPRAKSCYMGVWERGAFVGALVFGLGAGAATDGRKFGLAQSFGVAELERVALRSHRAPVSRIVGVGLRLLRAASPGLRLVVSYADPAQGHAGGIYQAGNWVYVGDTLPDWCVEDKQGKRWHSRVVSSGAPKMQFGRPTVGIRLEEGTRIVLPGKHKCLYPLDAAMRAQIAPLAKPYPKRAAEPTSVGTGDQPDQGGATPTRPLTTEAARV